MTELRNLETAISLNRKQTRISQVKLSNYRAEHQQLVKRFLFHLKTLVIFCYKYIVFKYILSTNFRSQASLKSTTRLGQHVAVPKKQKENIMYKPETAQNMDLLKQVKVSVVNDLDTNKSKQEPNLSVRLDVGNNKKIFQIIKDKAVSDAATIKDAVKANCHESINNNTEQNIERQIQSGIDKAINIIKSCTEEAVEPDDEIHIIVPNNDKLKPLDGSSPRNSADDYESPLQAILSGT